jgi:hypothetical protein
MAARTPVQLARNAAVSGCMSILPDIIEWVPVIHGNVPFQGCIHGIREMAGILH